MAAMRAKLTGTDAYLNEWRRADPQTVEGDLDDLAETAANDIETRYDQAKLKALIDNFGFEPSS